MPELPEHLEYALLTLESHQGVTPGEFGRLLYGHPKDKLSQWGRCGGAMLHALKDRKLCSFQERLVRTNPEVAPDEEGQYTGRTTSWITTAQGDRLAAAIRHQHRLSGTTPSPV